MTRWRQVGVLLSGLVLAGVMVLLGIWQLDVYRAQGEAVAQRRAAGPPVALRTVAPAGSAVGDGYGRTVTFSGRFDGSLQQLLAVEGDPDHHRVLTALRQDDGSVVAVVRGMSTAAVVPPPPTGPQELEGVLLPSEETVPGRANGQVVLPVLAQQWPGPLVSGFVTLSAAESSAQQLEPAPVALPQAQGRLRNGAYAIQWWLFAGFTLVMTTRIIRDVGRDADAALDEAAEINQATFPDPT
jgi:surfeit locus 1 family protein